MILCIETTSDICSAAIVTEHGVMAIRESGEDREHSRLLAPYINELFNETGIGSKDLDAVAISAGPGSYTGLRIGTSLAKGIAYGSGIPLIAVDTMLALWHNMVASYPSMVEPGSDRLFVPMTDARRMEVYCSVIAADGTIVSPVSATIIDEESFSNLLEKGEVLFFGSGAEKCRSVITRPGAIFPEERIGCSAAAMREPAIKACSEKRFEDVAYFQPLYLKEFMATRPKKSLP